MKPGDLVQFDPGSHPASAYIRNINADMVDQILTVVEVVPKDVDSPEHVVVLTNGSELKKVYQEHLKLIASANPGKEK